MNKAIYLDRDGVINPLIWRGNRGWTPPWNISEFSVFPWVQESIKYLKNSNYKVFVVSNQPDVYSSEMPWEFTGTINQILLDNLGIDDIMTCHQRGHYNYKPNPGMLITLRDAHNIDVEESWMVGDTWKDAVAAHIAHVNYIHVGMEDPISSYVFANVDTLEQAVPIILDPEDF
jgi:D-glycero-D-manno-heptose 1,7-bisphosphate phosphatase